MPAQKMKLLRCKSPLPLVLALMIGVAGIWLFALFPGQTNKCASTDSFIRHSRAGARGAR